jgi:uncharacterized protein YprB with RNaseH-like and TPR domain
MEMENFSPKSRFVEAGDEKALSALLTYNREDVLQMVRIRTALRRGGFVR